MLTLTGNAVALGELEGCCRRVSRDALLEEDRVAAKCEANYYAHIRDLLCDYIAQKLVADRAECCTCKHEIHGFCEADDGLSGEPIYHPDMTFPCEAWERDVHCRAAGIRGGAQ